jgi:hypothetical protein
MRPFLAVVVCASLILQSQQLSAEQRQGQPPPVSSPRGGTPTPPPAQPPDPGLPPDAANVRLDFAITDTYSGTPTKKTVSMLMLPGGTNSSIRTSSDVPFAEGNRIGVFLNVDANVRTFPGGLIRARVRFEYSPAPAANADSLAQAPRPANLNESLTVVLRDGKPLMVSQSADPASTRQVTVELTATVVK